MNVKVNFLCTVVLCCLCHGDCLGASSAVSAGSVTPCIGDSETVSFCDAYFTRLAFRNRRVKCRGVLTKIKYGPLVLEPVEGEMREDEHIVHANKWKFIGVHRCDGTGEHCPCNEDGTFGQGLDGKNVTVEGVLSESAATCSIASEDFLSPALFDSKITIGGGSSDTNNAVSAEKQRVMQFEYLSPCREFKVTIYLKNGGRYMIHYYSAVLWMAYVGPDRLAYITRPFPLRPQLADKKKVGKVWTMLNGLGTHISPSTNNSCRTSIKCRPKLYSQIKAIEIHNPCDELLKSAKDLFHFVYEEQNKDSRGGV